jgi:hypothetical protein
MGYTDAGHVNLQFWVLGRDLSFVVGFASRPIGHNPKRY